MPKITSESFCSPSHHGDQHPPSVAEVEENVRTLGSMRSSVCRIGMGPSGSCSKTTFFDADADADADAGADAVERGEEAEAAIEYEKILIEVILFRGVVLLPWEEGGELS